MRSCLWCAVGLDRHEDEDSSYHLLALHRDPIEVERYTKIRCYEVPRGI